MSKAARRSLPVAHSYPVDAIRRIVGRAALAVGFVVPAALGAQAWAYPSFQPPRVINREFNFGVADAGDAGTSLIFQWREGLSNRSQLGLDVGFADPKAKGNGKFVLGGQYGYLFTQGNAEMPLDFLGTAGIGFAFGDGGNLVRIPLGVSIGHRFPLDQGFAITPYVHPRASIDICSDCSSGGGNETDLGIDFDIGANFEVTKQLSFRVSALFGGSDTFGDSDGFGISLAWSPPQLSKVSKLIGR
jgi:hypothetical protein